MSTITKEFTKEQLIEKLKHRISVASGFPDSEKAQMDLELARIALASLEAEPVALRDERSGSGGISKKPGFNDLPHGAPLYTAPPAPVSDSLMSELLAIAKKAADAADECAHAEWSDDSMEHSTAIADWERRAAMLQGADGNSPVIPDGWVACSERMPEVGVKVLCFPINDEPIHATYNGQVWLQDISWSTSDEPIDNVISCNVFHWMPLPAAPQQEVK
ncbi:DUF551 domain-containing protein [Enterobacter hormaechei subsp. oharae]|jgi:hypothetical protein|uniref:DUF551 domain-containing protein n=1 Tax=Enterobacter hormaechei TaxID=158836 RepID=UPI000EB14D1E|nr:DUF551 domain-containing protein [Enterobacter hormaechei]EKS6362170.1 DUF551 domain-containing protein [Enterobacter hormaechei]MDU2723773.1 DUF551 domain-containing protein [Enterobacter hormaechei]